MFIVVPLSHEQNMARRWPWVTTLIILSNIVVFGASWSSDRDANEEITRRATRALEHFVEHPEVEFSPELRESLPAFARVADGLREHAANEPSKKADADDESVAATQAEFDEYVQALIESRSLVTAWQFGYRPGGEGALGLLTHQFLHADVFHLLFNLWFLWLLGCNVEDSWGRLLFPAFYLTAGAFAGWIHGVMAPPSGAMLIGASGAVAAAMGAFLVRFGRTKIRFFGLLLIRPFTFSAPAYLMLPLWVGIEIFWGLADANSGVAHWAHVGGFAYGFAIAAGLQLSGASKQLEAAVGETSEVFTEDPELVAATRAIDAGNAADAIEPLERLSRQRTATVSVFLELARAKLILGDNDGVRAARMRLVEWHLQRQQADEALEVFEELSREQAALGVPPNLRLRLARQYRRKGQLERAASEFQLIHAAPKASEYSLPALLGHAELALELGRNDAARQLYEQAQFFASRDMQVQAAIKQGLARAGQARRPSTSPPPAGP